MRVEQRLEGQARTMGSCETGLAEISTLESAPRPATLSVHDCLLFETHVIYCNTHVSPLTYQMGK